MKKQMILPSLWILLLSIGYGSCKTKQKQIHEQTTSRQATIFNNKKDSLYISELKNLDTRKTLTLKHVAFFPPDSQLQQFVKSVSWLEEHSSESTQEQTDIIDRKVESNIKSIDENHSEKEEITKKYSSLGFKARIIGAGLFIFIVLLFKIKKLCH